MYTKTHPAAKGHEVVSVHTEFELRKSRERCIEAIVLLDVAREPALENSSGNRALSRNASAGQSQQLRQGVRGTENLLHLDCVVHQNVRFPILLEREQSPISIEQNVMYRSDRFNYEFPIPLQLVVDKFDVADRTLADDA